MECISEDKTEFEIFLLSSQIYINEKTFFNRKHRKILIQLCDTRHAGHFKLDILLYFTSKTSTIC